MVQLKQKPLTPTDSLELAGKPTQSDANSYESLTTAPNKFPFYLAIALGLHCVTVFFLVLYGVALVSLAYRPIPTLVQTPDGELITTDPAPSWYREPQVIKNFVGRTATLLFSWSGQAQLPNEEGELEIQTDPGVVVGENAQLTTPAFEASFALSSSFRESFSKQLAKLIPPGVWSGKSQVHIEFVRIGDPQPQSSVTSKFGEHGYWQVPMVANLIIRDAKNPGGRAVPFNKTIYVRAIDTPPLPIPEQATALQQTVHQIRLSQLEIYQIKDLEKP